MNSLLNPEAPEFFPNVIAATEVQINYKHPKILFYKEDNSPHFASRSSSSESYKAVTVLGNTVRYANSFPSGAKYGLLNTYPTFEKITHVFDVNVTAITNEIVKYELPEMRLIPKEKDHNSEIMVDCYDRFLDRAEINMEALDSNETFRDMALEDIKPSTSKASGNNKLIVTKIQVGSSTFVGAKNIPRPQLTFKDPVDNSTKLWVPKISDKPNNIKPLALNIIYDDQGEAVGYEHPYKVELELYEPPEEFIKPDPEPPRFPAPVQDTKYTYIDTESKIDELVEHLNTVKEIAVDVEHHSYRTYQGITCLIQISTDEGGDFIIDTLAVREHVHKLNLSFTDPRKVKVFHGADMDVLWLQRDFGVYIVGLFDTYRAAKMLFKENFSLKHMLIKYCDITVDKTYQLADWRMRPLPDELVHYARLDTHYLLYVWRRMKAALLETSNGTDQLLRAVFTRSKFVCGGTYKKMVVTEKSHKSVLTCGKRKMDSRQMAALKKIYEWRDTQARMFDESTSYILPSNMLVALARTLPREVQGVHAICTPMPTFIKHNVLELHTMILSCRDMPLEPEPYDEASTSSDHVPQYQRQPPFFYDVHDLPNSNFMNYDDDEDFTSDDTTELHNTYTPYLDAIVPDEEKGEFFSNLNVDAQMYIPPYYRYRGYRYLAKEEELIETSNKEAKVAAIVPGDPLLKPEVRAKLNERKKALDNSSEKTVQRKRKMSTEKVESEMKTNAQQGNNAAKNARDNVVINDGAGPSNSKNFTYHGNYKKFQNDGQEMGKQAKKKFTKYN